MIKYIILLGLLLAGCSHKTTKSSTINVEMVGSWKNTTGCSATFTKTNDQLVLESFTDGRQNSLSDILLKSEKISIMTTFKAQNAKVNFSGSFVEGVVIIKDYCTEPLHKTDS